MKMSEEMAVRLHRMMWSDMQRELGDTPDSSDRKDYKKKWCETHFPEEHILFNCFLCDYCDHDFCDRGCGKCPIEWPDGTCSSTIVQPPVKTDYRFAPISEILALPTRNKELVTGYVVNDEAALARSYYEYREQLLSKASGIPASSAIDDHVKAIVKKAVEGKDRQLKSDRDMMSLAYCNAKKKLSEASGLEDFCTTEEHIKTIQEKAVEEYFKKTPGAKLATMDVDNAFKQYAEEQKAPIFRELAKESGLDPTSTVKAHIDAIYSNGFDDGEDEEFERIMDKIVEILKK